MTIDEKHIPTVRHAKPTEIIVSPGQLVQVLNIDAQEGAIPHCRFAFQAGQTPRTQYLDCQSPCLGANSNASNKVGDLVQRWMLSTNGFSTPKLLEVSGLLEVAHQPLGLLEPDQRLRLQTLQAVLEGTEVLVFNSPWAQDGTDGFILDLLRFLRQHHAQSGILPVFVVCDCRDLPALIILADSIWEVEKGMAVEVEMEYGSV